MSNLKRNHYCGTLGKADNEKEVVLCGWVAKRRDHGGLIFVDLRDRSGIVQVVVDPDHAGSDFATAEAIRSEYVIKVHGVVRLRSEEFCYINLLYDILCLIKRRVRVDLDGYHILDRKAKAHFDLIAPVFLFCGDDTVAEALKALDPLKQPYRQEAWKILKQNKLFSPEWMDLYKRFCSVFYLT